jgi:hypothetical protein
MNDIIPGDGIESRAHQIPSWDRPAWAVRGVKAGPELIWQREASVDVILGGGLELDVRLQIVRSVFENSASTTGHMNSPSGPESYLPFVRAVLRGFGVGH